LSGAACTVHQASFIDLAIACTTAGLFKDPRGSLPVVWVTSRLGNAKWPKAMFTGEDEPFARRARVS
jgi:hypothetical protein